MEDYRDIDGYDGIYKINSKGEVYKRVNPEMSTTGYKTVRIHLNGKSTHKSIHRLLMSAFVPNPENKPFVNHIDGDKLNCSLDNLEWCTPSENTQHAYDTGLQSREKNFPTGK